MLVNPKTVWDGFVRWYSDNYQSSARNAAVEHIEAYARNNKTIDTDECFIIINSVIKLCNQDELDDWRVARICAFGLMGIPTVANEISPPDVIGMAMVSYLSFMFRPGNWFFIDRNKQDLDIEKSVNDAVRKYFYAACEYHGHVIVPKTLDVIVPDDYGERIRNLPKEYIRQVTVLNRNIDRLVIDFDKAGGR